MCSGRTQYTRKCCEHEADDQDEKGSRNEQDVAEIRTEGKTQWRPGDNKIRRLQTLVKPTGAE